MSNWKGETLQLSVFGHSHGPYIGMTFNGVPAGYTVDTDELQNFLNRRAPGNDPLTTTRKEMDAPHFQSGLASGCTSGDPIRAVINNTNIRSNDYAVLQNRPRPGHADYTAKIKYGMDYDIAGGGHFSGRLTAPICIAGGMCLQWLRKAGVQVFGHICAIDGIEDLPYSLEVAETKEQTLDAHFPVINQQRSEQMRARIAEAKANGDSVGGIIECVVTGLPAGIGGPLFEGLEGNLSQALFGIPAVKGVEFGSGFRSATMRGSQNNDAYAIQDGKIVTQTNHAGGILGGITNGMPVTLRLAIKPTPSIAKEQQTVDLSTLQSTMVEIKGRHDPCIVPRAVPVVEATVAIVIFDAILSLKQKDTGDLNSLRNEIDHIDGQLVQLFSKRMEIAKEIGYLKQEMHLPIYDPERENNKLKTITTMVDEEMGDYIRALYSSIFEISKNYQNNSNSKNVDKK